MKNIILTTLIILSLTVNLNAQTDCYEEGYKGKSKIARENMDEGDDGLTCANAAKFYTMLCEYYTEPLTPEEGQILRSQLITTKKAYNDYGVYCKDIGKIGDIIPNTPTITLDLSGPEPDKDAKSDDIILEAAKDILGGGNGNAGGASGNCNTAALNKFGPNINWSSSGAESAATRYEGYRCHCMNGTLTDGFTDASFDPEPLDTEKALKQIKRLRQNYYDKKGSGDPELSPLPSKCANSPRRGATSNNYSTQRQPWENQLEGLYVKEMAENMANAYSKQIDQFTELMETNDPDAFINDFNQKIQNINTLNQQFKQDQWQLGLEGATDLSNAINNEDEASFYRSVGAITGLIEMGEARKAARKKEAALYEQRRQTMSRYYWDAIDRTDEQIEDFKKMAAFSESKRMEAYYLKLVENLQCFKVQMDKNWTSENTSWLKNTCPLPQKPEKELPNNLISKEQRFINVAKYKFTEYQKRREEYYGIGAEIGEERLYHMPLFRFNNIKTNSPIFKLNGLSKEYTIKELKVFYSELEVKQLSKKFSSEEKLKALQEIDTSLAGLSALPPELLNYAWISKAQLMAKGKRLTMLGTHPWSNLIPVNDGYFYRLIKENTWVDKNLKFDDIWSFTLKKEDEINKLLTQVFPYLDKEKLEYWKKKFIQEKEEIRNAKFNDEAYTGYTSGNTTVDEFYHKFILFATLYSHPLNPLANEFINQTYRVKEYYLMMGGTNLKSINKAISENNNFQFMIQEFLDIGGLGEFYPLIIRKKSFITNKGENYRNAAISFASKAASLNPTAENYYRVAQYAKDESSVISLTNLIAAHSLDKNFLTGDKRVYLNQIQELVNEEIKTAIEEKNTKYIDGFLKSRLQKFVKINNKDIFVYAVELDRPEVVQRILNQYVEGVSDTKRKEITQTAMLACAEYDSPKTLQKLIELGLSTNFNSNGKTLKSVAKENNSSRVLSILNN